MTDEEIVQQLLLSFMREMRDVEIEAYKILKEDKEKGLVHSKRAFEFLRENVDNIYIKYLTVRDRKYNVRHNGISSKPDYDLELEKIIRIEKKSKRKIEVYTHKTDTLEFDYQYVFILNDGKWKLDNKKWYLEWKKNKWDPTII